MYQIVHPQWTKNANEDAIETNKEGCEQDPGDVLTTNNKRKKTKGKTVLGKSKKSYSTFLIAPVSGKYYPSLHCSSGIRIPSQKYSVNNDEEGKSEDSEVELHNEKDKNDKEINTNQKQNTKKGTIKTESRTYRTSPLFVSHSE